MERTCGRNGTGLNCACGSREEPAGREMALFPREVRLGLVMYGGVSLAVYINGVAGEFFEAVRGTGIYGLLKCLRQSEIVVDIISGASAGGVNGILLGYALSGQDRDIRATTDLWRTRGGIRELFQAAAKEPPPSLFDGDGYYTNELMKAFQNIGPVSRGEEVGSTCRLPSPVDALDLFITGTDYHGKTWSFRDALGSSIQGKDHRGVFRLKLRKGGRNDFQEPAPLAKLARLTSSFPGAFAPVHVSTAKRPDGGPSADQPLGEWAQLEDASSTHFFDGGVLDNKPFTQTTEQIYYRLAHQPVDRKLFFVEPDPEQLPAPVAEASARSGAPDILGVMVKSLVTLPRYESIASDLREIERYNASIRRRRKLLDACGEGADRAGYPDASAAQRRLYDGCRWQWLEDLVYDAVESLPRPIHLDGWTPSIEPLPEALDVEFSLRRLFHVTYRLYDRLYEPSGTGEAGTSLAQSVLFALNRHIQLLKIAGWAVERAVGKTASAEWASLSPKALTSQVAAALQSVLERGDAAWEPLDEPTLDSSYLPDCLLGRRVRDVLDKRLAVLREDAARPLGAAPRAGAARPATLLTLEEELTRRVFAAAGDDDRVRSAQKEYESFAALDVHLYPLEAAAGLREKDEIETIRISAHDAQLGFSARDADKKVSGDALGHFGGFFKRSWRANDIMWGRLDSRCQLIRALLDEDHLAARTRSPQARQAIRASIADFLAPLIRDAVAGAKVGDSAPPAIRDLPVEQLFPTADEGDVAGLKNWLDEFLADDDPTHEGALRRLGGELDRIVRVAQSEIVHAGVGDVVGDASTEAADWGEPSFATPRDLDLDELARSPAAFEKEYTVGEERMFRSIPPRILLGLFARGCLILRDAIFAAADTRARRRGGLLLRPLLFTRKVLGWPLHVAYWYATVTTWRPIRMGAMTVAVTLAVAALWLGKSALGTVDDAGVWRLSWLNLGIFVGAPAALFLSEVVVRRLGRETEKRRALVRLVPLLAGVGLAAGLVSWGAWSGSYDGLLRWLASFSGPKTAAFLIAPVVIALFLVRYARSVWPPVKSTEEKAPAKPQPMSAVPAASPALRHR